MIEKGLEAERFIQDTRKSNPNSDDKFSSIYSNRKVDDYYFVDEHDRKYLNVKL